MVLPEKRDKRDSVVKAIRQRIVAGQLSPGQQLPTRSEFEEEFDASRFTIQQVFDQLRVEGFIRVSGRRATYVVDHPPHLSHYALLFPTEPSSDPWQWPQSWQALIHEASVLQHETHRTIRPYYGIHAGAEHEQYRQLEHSVRAHRLAGLIFANRSMSFFGDSTFVMTEQSVPRVAITSEHGVANRIPLVCRDYQSFFDRALDRLAGVGRKRVATLMTPYRYDQMANALQSAVATRGMMAHPYWTQIVHPSGVSGGRLAAHLLFSASKSQRPNALIVADDNLLDAALAGLIAANVRVPDEVAVISHAAFPSPKAQTLPVTRLGFNTKEALRICLERIDQQRAGKKPPALTRMTAIFEDELEQAMAAGVGE